MAFKSAQLQRGMSQSPVQPVAEFLVGTQQRSDQEYGFSRAEAVELQLRPKAARQNDSERIRKAAERDQHLGS